MLVSDLFNKVLVEPAKKGADQLNIISGYATSSMVARHFEEIKQIREVSVNLIYGMAAGDGVPMPHHKGFKRLSEKDYRDRFWCGYVINSPPVHSKVFVWTKKDIPQKAFCGSANYTLNGFGKTQLEVMDETDASSAIEYYKEIEKRTYDCQDENIEDSIKIRGHKEYRQEGFHAGDLPCVVLPLTSKQLDGEVHNRAGLNWGQRPDRDPNQAYIPIPSSVNPSFFPATREHFTLLTDDGHSFVCTVAQDNRKALHSTLDNSEIGRYFRGRMGLRSGVLVKRKDLKKYGRIDVKITKLDDETYWLDFSPNMGP